MTAAAVLVAALVSPAAAVAASSWRVTGSLAGNYENAVTWENCPGAVASFAEKVTVDTPMRGVRPLMTNVSIPGVVLKVTPGGSWNLSGSYPPRRESPRGGEFTCGAPVAVSCGNGIVSGGGAPAVLDLVPAGRVYRTTFRGFPGVVESAAMNPPADQPMCGGGGADDTLAVPLLGLGPSEVASSAWTQSLTITKSKFRRSRAFKVTATGTPGPCNDLYASCTQSGSVTMTLAFSPSR